MSATSLTANFADHAKDTIPPKGGEMIDTAAIDGALEKSSQIIEPGEFNGPFRAYKMPQGQTLYMNPDIYESLGEKALLEIGEITAGKNTVFTTKPEAASQSTCIMDDMRISESKAPAALNADYLHPWPAPLNRIAENFVLLPENNGETYFEDILKNNYIPAELFDIQPDYQKGVYTFIALHESGHIKDSVDRPLFEILFEINPSDEHRFAGEIYADNIAKAAADRLGFAYEADLYISFRAIRDFSNMKENFHDIDSMHATPILIEDELRLNADDHVEDANKFYGEINKTVELVDNVNSKLFDVQDAPTINNVDEAKVLVSALLITRFATTKALLEQDKITDPEQKTYAEYFAGAMERHLDPTLLHDIESQLLPKARAELSQMDPLELQAIIEPTPNIAPPAPSEDLFANTMIGK